MDVASRAVLGRTWDQGPLASGSDLQTGEFSTIGLMGARRRIVEEHRDKIADVARRNRAVGIRLFGSAARDEDTERSDLDFLVDFEDGSSLFDLMHLRDDLEELLGCPVDVVSVGGLTARDEHILAEAIPL